MVTAAMVETPVLRVPVAAPVTGSTVTRGPRMAVPAVTPATAEQVLPAGPVVTPVAVVAVALVAVTAATVVRAPVGMVEMVVMVMTPRAIPMLIPVWREVMVVPEVAMARPVTAAPAASVVAARPDRPATMVRIPVIRGPVVVSAVMVVMAARAARAGRSLVTVVTAERPVTVLMVVAAVMAPPVLVRIPLVV